MLFIYFICVVLDAHLRMSTHNPWHTESTSNPTDLPTDSTSTTIETVTDVGRLLDKRYQSIQMQNKNKTHSSLIYCIDNSVQVLNLHLFTIHL